MRSHFILAMLALTAGGCSSANVEPVLNGRTQPVAIRGQEFAQAHCSGCHAVVPLTISPDPEAPAFDAIVNVPGLTLETLKVFLRDSHNFPEVMDFDVDPDQVDALAAYMLTLQE
jgi:mono/diheme cytochrome c family protein